MFLLYGSRLFAENPHRQQECFYSKGDKVNIRAEPSLKGDVVGQVYLNDRVCKISQVAHRDEIQYSEGFWLKVAVIVNGRTVSGWVFDQLLSKKEVQPYAGPVWSPGKKYKAFSYNPPWAFHSSLGYDGGRYESLGGQFVRVVTKDGKYVTKVINASFLGWNGREQIKYKVQTLALPSDVSTVTFSVNQYDISSDETKKFLTLVLEWGWRVSEDDYYARLYGIQKDYSQDLSSVKICSPVGRCLHVLSLTDRNGGKRRYISFLGDAKGEKLVRTKHTYKLTTSSFDLVALEQLQSYATIPVVVEGKAYQLDMMMFQLRPE